MPPLTHAEVLTLLEKAQSAPSAEAASIISSLPQRTTPQPRLTEPFLDLLQIHPKETLPHIADLLSSTATQQLLETLSSLLSSDRQLLPPILGILPSLPLTPDQRLQTRATIAYALDIVDRHDIPTVVRTLSAMPSMWAADTLRTRIRLNADITPVVAEALSDVLTPKNHLAERLLAPRPPPRSLDILFLVQALESRLSRLARRSLSTLTQSGSFSRCSYPKTVACLSTMLPTYVHGTERLLATIISSTTLEPGEIVTVAKFCKSMIMACPPAAVGISSARGFVATTVHTFLISSLDNPRLRPNSLHRIPEIAVTALMHTDPPNWEPLFISVRKGALFGTPEDYRRVESLSRCVVERANEETVRHLFEILDASIGECLAESLAVVLLDLLGDAAMRGMFMENIFRKRIDKLPTGLLSRMNEDGQEVVQVDIGIIWEQRASAVASVVSSAIAMMLANRGIEGIAKGLVDVSVLVPVVCVTLYEAIEDLSEPVPFSSKGRRRSRVIETIPARLSELESSELRTAVLSFATGIATIVGLLNRSSRWLGICRRVIEKRHEASVEEKDLKIMWMVLDRLTEFHRMQTALALAMEVLQRQWNDLRTSQKGAERGRRRKREVLREMLEQVQAVRDSVFVSLDAEESTRRRGQEGKEYDFPRFSLNAIVVSLVAIPDEEGIGSVYEETTCKQMRDMELVRLDKLLLFQLLRLMTPTVRGLGALGDGKEDSNTFSKARKVKVADWVSQNFFDVDKAPPLSIAEIIPDFEKQLEEKDDLFFNEEEFSEDEAMEEDDEKPTVLWAPNISNNHLKDMAYVQSTVSLLLTDGSIRDHRTSHNAASLVHSPAFAALLLDRAATYVAVARKARLRGCDEMFLSDIVMASGLALCCLNGVLRIIPMLNRTSDEIVNSVRSAGETEMVSCNFLNEVGERLLVGVPPCEDAEKHPSIISNHLSKEGWKVIATLRWIANTSVEAAVGSSAMEGILTISEYDVCHKSYARQLAFSFLTMVYEYEGRALWEENVLDVVLKDTYSEWSLRRRRSQERAEEHVDQLDSPDPSPWIDLKLKKLRRKRLERQRLSLYFSGMHVPDALMEGCGWVREMSVALSAGTVVRGEESTIESSKGESQEDGHRKSVKRKRVEPQQLVRKEVLTCDTLLDMIGFRTITEVLMDIVVQGLQAYPVSTSMPVEEANAEWSNPIPHLRTSLRLFCGLVCLYHENRQKLVSASRDAGSSMSVDLEFDYSMITAFIAVLQLTRTRTDELFAWYSNASTEVSQLSSKMMNCIEQVIGCAAQAVNRCCEVAESIKVDQGGDINEEATGSRSRGKKGRKTPGYEKRRRKGRECEEVSKARRMIPRLTGQSENVVKSLQKLAKTVGVRARQNLSGLAAPPVASDDRLRFGIGLNDGVDDNEESRVAVDESEAGRSKTSAGLSLDNGMEIEGFHVRCGKGDQDAQVAVEETITVNCGAKKIL